MTTWPLRRLPAGAGPAVLLLGTTLPLVAFYYVARADTIGAFLPARGWSPLTGPALPATWHYVASLVLLGILPLLMARLTGVRWTELGLGIGKWRAGLAVVAIGIPLALLAGWIASQAPAIRAVYPLDSAVTAAPGSFIPHALRQLLYYGSWEVLFRGVLLFGLRRQTGDVMAVSFQTALSVTAHFGRALNETAAAIPGGLLFGFLSLRLGSIWYIALLHWLLGVSMEWFILTA